jgi:hypothetical protein
VHLDANDRARGDGFVVVDVDDLERQQVGNVQAVPSTGTLPTARPRGTVRTPRSALICGLNSMTEVAGSGRMYCGSSSSARPCTTSGTASSTRSRILALRNAKPSSSRSTSGSSLRSDSKPALVGFAVANSRPISRR